MGKKGAELFPIPQHHALILASEHLQWCGMVPEVTCSQQDPSHTLVMSAALVSDLVEETRN